MKQMMRMGLAVVLAVWATATAVAGDYARYYVSLPVEMAQVAPPQIPDRTVSLPDVGGVGDGITLNTEAIQRGINQLAKQGGGRLVVPEGVWLTGPIQLKDNTELHLEKNAILYFSPDKRLYVDPSGKSNRCYPGIRASKRQNIAITGQGVIDGNGAQWRPVKKEKVSSWEWKAFKNMGGVERKDGSLWYPWQMRNGYPDIADTPEKQERMRADLIRLTDCVNVLVQGVTVQNSPRFHVHPCFCTNVIIDGVTVRCPWNAQNGDAIDLSDCHRALIVNCTVDAGDDGLCMKSGLPKEGKIAGCEDILIQDNTVLHAHGGFVIGSEDAGGIRRLVVRHNRMLGTDTGLRFKSGLGRGGRTENIFISDIVMTDIKDEAIIFQCDYLDRPAGSDPDAVPTFTEEQRRWAPEFTDIHICRVTCRGARTAIRAGGIRGLRCVHGIDISDCTLMYTETATQIDAATAELKLSGVNLVPYKAE